jgi:hypothetical protein
MRTFALIGFFVLAVVAIVEGAVIARLSGRIETLARRAPTGDLPERGQGGGAPDRAPAAGTVALARPAPNLPRLLTTATPDNPAAAPAAAVLREALDSSEGRQHLKAALEILREQDKQEKLAGRADRAALREQQRVQELTKILALSSDEQGKVGQLYATLQSNRRRVLDEMHAGQKDSGQADDEIDKFRDETDTSVRALLGEPRMRQFREATQGQRRRGGNPGPSGGGPAPGAGQPASIPPPVR